MSKVWTEWRKYKKEESVMQEEDLLNQISEADKQDEKKIATTLQKVKHFEQTKKNACSDCHGVRIQKGILFIKGGGTNRTGW